MRSPLNSCRLCGRETELKMSHVVPRFVWRWLRDSSPTGYLRDFQAPDRRIQDGWKAPLLCHQCEQLLSGAEKPFAERVFVPLHSNAMTSFPHGPWALRFAVSVLWRTIIYGGEERLAHLNNDQRAAIRNTEQVWREFLLAQRPHPGIHEAHLIPLDVLQNGGEGEMSPYLNRYFLRSVDLDIVASPSEVLVYAKLCRVLLLGHVIVRARGKWRASRVAVQSGVIGGAVEYWLPAALGTFMNGKADLNATAFQKMSAPQKGKLRAALGENLDALARSETFRAMESDVRRSGQRAFRITESPHETED
jgi:hypothetical protein